LFALHVTAPESGEQEVAEPIGFAGVKVGVREVEAEVALEVREAVDERGPVEGADVLDEGFIKLSAAHGAP
jgi:hypothetical protein